MTTNHHTAISTGAAANASTFNNPLGQLDAQITTNAAAIAANALLAAATTAEVIAARDGSVDLNSRLGAMVMAGSNVSTLTNGAANASQKVITVDSTTGFLAGAPIVYTLVGGVVETNTIDTVDSPTQLTCDVNIGTGGIANDTYIAVIPPGVLVATGATIGAGSVEQVFTKGISLPVPTGAAGFFVSSFAATFNAVVDPVGTWGYNALRGGRDVAGEGTAAWSIEADYYATANGELRHLAETYFATNNDAGTAARRWMALTVDREVPEGYSAIEFLIAPSAAGQLTIGRSDTTASLFQFIGTGEFALLGANQAILFSAGGSLEVTTNAPLTFIANNKRTNMSPTVDGFEFGADRDTNLYRSAANTLKTDVSLQIKKALTLTQMTAPDAPGASNVVIYAVDNGGKTELCARFPSGAVQQIAIEP